MNDSAVVIIATVGKSTLPRAIDSVLSQTHGNVKCLVVIDGDDRYDDAADVLFGRTRVEYEKWNHWKNRVSIITLPQNTGHSGFVCHRIYGAMPMLVNEEFIFYLDDDNWYDPNHVRDCVAACYENDLDWCFSLRNIYKDGEFLCRDECESVGLWPVWYDESFSHIDTNCFCLRRQTAVDIAPRWHKSRLDKNGNILPSADTQICNWLKKNRPRHALVPKFDVNYELGSSALSPTADFFLDGNVRFAAQYGTPWEVVK